MVSFRRRKKAAKEKGKLEAKEEKSKTTKTETTSEKNKTPKRKKKPSKAAAVLPRSVSKEYNSPLTTITESHDEEPVTPATESSLLQTVNVVTTNDESMEVVVGSASSTTTGINPELTREPTLLLEQVHVFDKQNAKETDTEVVMSQQTASNHDDIRKALFQEEEVDKRMAAVEEEEEEEVAIVTPEPRVAPEEPPFDQKADYGGDEDPAILDLIERSKKEHEQKKDDQSGSAQNSITSTPVDIEDGVTPKSMFKSDIRDASITKKLLAAFNCNLDTSQDIQAPACKGMSAFYDTMCSDVRGKRPFFSEEFTRDFMEDAVKDGIPLMYHYEVETDGGPGAPPEWRGHSVTMFVKQGCYQSSQIVHPRLEWPTPEQQWTTERPGTVNLMDIQSIYDSSQDDVRDDLEEDTTELMDLCFFSITTKNGEVYMFEAASPAERDWIVTGLKNVIVRLSYQLTVGDPGISEELFSGEYEYGSGDLPTLKTPVQAMNEVAHAFLD